MRLWITRFLFLLISANVVYGTHGDIYADKVQVLIKPSSESISYSPGVNTDLFTANKYNESSRLDRLYSKSSRTLSEWGTFVFHSLIQDNWGIGTLNGENETAYLRNRTIREMIFPHHYFS
ncbi:hypothetical protein AAOE16_08270 [Ekhidna sp. MALMAid0563]|uniref:hypothetical protein n=1 Tax=Ekhidna sp. MALMAid0563 TaxID=3143937 RepID=UPI0032E038D6